MKKFDKRKFANYEFIHDGTYSYIRGLESEQYRPKVDNDYYFYSLKKAQKALIRHFKHRIIDYKMAYKNAKEEYKKL